MYEKAVLFCESQKKSIAPYLNHENGTGLIIPSGYIQTFRQSSKRSFPLSEDNLLKDFYTMSADARKVGIEIVEFLLHFKCASAEQIKELIIRKGMFPEYVAPLLKRLTELQVLNYFALAKSKLKYIPEDAFLMYCLDSGAVSILHHLSNFHQEIWFSSDVIYNSDMIARHLMIVTFYLQALATGSGSIAYFMPWKKIRVGKKEIPFSAEFWVMKNGEKSVYLLDAVNPQDLQEIWPEKMERLAMFLQESERWSQYYREQPKFIFLAYNEQDARRMAESFYMRTGYNGFRVLTTANMMKGLDGPVFYSYIPVSEKNPEAVFKLKKLGIFSAINAQNPCNN